MTRRAAVDRRGPRGGRSRGRSASGDGTRAERATSFDGLPKGVTVEPAGSVIKNGDAEAKFVLKAAADAALGDFAVNVTGHPMKGADATHEFKFTVAKK